jgi:hypothetical protein
MRYAFMTIVAAAAMTFHISPAAAGYYFMGSGNCWGFSGCCRPAPAVTVREITYRKRYVAPRRYAIRSVRTYRDPLDGFIPEIASRRIACCGY